MFELIKKDVLLIIRDPSNLIMIIMLPLLIATVFGSVNSSQDQFSDIRVRIVDLDATEESAGFVKAFSGRAEISAISTDLETAQDAVRLGEAVAYLVIQPGFGQALSRFPLSRESPKMEIVSDPKQRGASGLLVGATMAAAVQRIEDRLAASASDGERTINLQPVNITTSTYAFEQLAPTTGFDVTIPQAALWSILSCVALMSTSLSVERVQHTILRLRSSPMSMSKILTSKVLACMLAILLSMTVIVLFGMLIFKISIYSIPILFIAGVAASFCFAGLMLAIGSLGRDPGSVAGSAWSIMVFFALIGGGMMPYFLMPDWLKLVSNLSPGKWAIVSLEGAIWRNFSLAEVAGPALVLIVVGTLGTVFGVRRLTREAIL